MITTIALIIGFIFLLTYVYGSISAAPWVPTKKSDIGRFLDIAEIKKGDIVMDLGCGDGRLLFGAAKRGAKGIGYEVSLLPYLLAKMQSYFLKEDVKIMYKDFWGADISKADVIYVFLMRDTYPKLLKKIDKEEKKGAKLITYVWPIPDREAYKEDKLDKKCNLYCYKI